MKQFSKMNNKMSIKEEISIAIEKSLESDKLFILSMTNLKNRKLGFEDRLTSELAFHIGDGYAIHEYKLSKENNNEYIDIVKFDKNSLSFNESDIVWALEAKILYSYQRHI